MKAEDRVIGVVVGKSSRAYPLKILNYHEVVNDRLDGVPIAVTYCPLCDSAAVFDRRTELGEHEFGVSGLLFNSNVLMYDRGGQPESLWSQMLAQGVSGPAAGKPLKTRPVELTTWQDWLGRHPETTLLSDRTGHARNYEVNPYRPYFDSSKLMFPVAVTDRRLPPKERVLGLWTGNEARAYALSAPFLENPELGDQEQELGGRKFTLQYDAKAKSVRVTRADDGLQWMYSFWFVWYAFRPQTELIGIQR